MSFSYTNPTNISLPLTMFLLSDGYDYDARPNSISTTTLIRPLRQLVLTQQNKGLKKSIDIAELAASRMGTAMHDAFEKACSKLEVVQEAMRLHGIPEKVIERAVINPEVVNEGDVPIYVEQRSEKELEGFIITGKFDLVMNGNLSDLKSTSCWSVIFGSNIENYVKQGSIYKWLNQDKITEDTLSIHYIFTDWSAVKAKQDSQYPQQRTMTKKYKLWDVEDTEAWIKAKLVKFKELMDLPQSALPECTDEELWASETKYKYYKNPNKLSRATKNFDTMDEALMRKSSDGDVGTILTVPGEVKACRYCPAIEICTQAERLLAEGRLLL